VILAGDVGGTKTVLALFERGGDAPVERERARYRSADHRSLAAMLEAFLAQHGSPHVEAACFGVAGPVVESRFVATNLAWDAVDEESLSSMLGGAPVALLNDLQAAGVGMLALGEVERVALNPGAGPPRRGNVAVIAPGTGLGEAVLVWDGDRHLPVAGEGGHGGFAPSSEEEIALLRFLQEEHGPRVSWERVLSGPGLASLYRFVRVRCGVPEPARLSARLRAEDPAAVVSDEGLGGRDPACAEALELFAHLTGAEAGDLALRTLAVGGVFVGGGIAPRLRKVLEGGAFLRAFIDKGRFEPLLRQIPVHLVLDPGAPVDGAARWAAGLRP